MKKINQTSVFALSALSAALISHTATVYASDIEIYKAPTQGGAYLMMVLDFSTSMRGSSPVKSDFFNGRNCSSESKTVSTSWNGSPHSFSGTYCWVKESQTKEYKTNQVKTVTTVVYKRSSNSNSAWYEASRSQKSRDTLTDSMTTTDVNIYSNLSDALQKKIDKSCVISDINTDLSDSETSESEGSYYDAKSSGGWNSYVNERKRDITTITWNSRTTEEGKKYSCPDRVTMLKKSLYDLIAGNSKVDDQTTSITPLGDTASIGFTRFPNPSVTRTPLVLNKANRTTLLEEITGYSNSSGTPIAHAYATGAAGLMANMPTGSEAACAGYGVYFLTDGEPWSDSTSSARTAINGYLSTSTTSTNCGSSWPCVTTIAEKLKLKQNTKNIEIKTAVVGFGNEFSFGAATYDPATTYKYSGSGPIAGDQTDLRNLFSAGSNALEAAKASVIGGGGWYSAANTTDVVKSVKDFVDSVTVAIPAITTGTATIPQDSLNTIAVQPYAYFPQFKPQPSETFQLWSGNLKKYKVVNSILEDKDGLKVFNDTNGQLNTATKDLWVKNIASSETELLAFGGMLSKLKLKGTTVNGFNRKVLTNSDTTLNTVTESFIKTNLTNRKYLLGLLGYDLTLTELNAITNTTSLTTLSPSKTLRNIGAIMHSTPILLTQEGKVTQGSNVDTTARKDYLLFGTTQGALHVVKAGAESDTGNSYTGGEEEFVFVPQETLSNQPLALLNEKESGTNGMSQLYYGVDGPWVAHTEYVYNSTDDKFYVKDGDRLGKQWVYGGMRMGGRSYYALDLTDISSPTIKFRIDPTSSKVYTSAKKEDGTNITSYSYSHLAKMGQSWSKPVITNVQWEGKRRLVMFVGGGYDSGYETFNYDQTSGVGAGVFMFDANTGEPLWSTYESATKGDGDDLKYSIVSQIKTIDRDGDGDVDHLYFGDLGGQVFRVDLNSSHPVLNISSTATPSQQASAIAASKASFANNIIRILDVHKANGLSPRFYEAPGFSVYNGTNGIYAVVSIGSGNRSNPLLGKIVNNNYIVSGETAALNASLPNDAIYNLFDTDVVKKDIPSTYTYVLRDTTPSALAIVNDTNRELGVKPTATTSNPNPQPANKIDFTGKKGWYYEFTSSTGRKAVEKVQGDIIVVDNDLYVTTFDAEAVGTTEACGAGIYGGSEAHRFCMPYGQCPNGETVAQNTLNLGKGILGITLGGGTDGSANTRSIVAPINSRNPASNKLLAALYKSEIKLTPLSWYEKN
ncbi:MULTISPECIES: PilC/PilY family type IV pilus protein [unclassified Acinetobacter]|uniref:PilC/PilY family type IV pilus protein n=1 Tax=unclassified Acinetobacter TaxID=196816 RepID=UPI0015D41C65|nr:MULTISPECIES: PilC/PilY family type IV pilus protein [unclassified Acinetobacter]